MGKIFAGGNNSGVVSMCLLFYLLPFTTHGLETPYSCSMVIWCGFLRLLAYEIYTVKVCVAHRTIVTSSGVGNLDDLEGGSVKHARHYQVYRGMSPTTSSRLEV